LRDVGQRMNSTRPLRLIGLAGLGADRRLFEPQRTLPFEIEVIDWPVPISRETLADYAARLAGQFDTTRPFLLCGISFGGIIAQEMVRHVSPQGIILISTFRSCASLPRHLRAAGTAARVLSPRVFDWLKFCSPVVRSRFGVKSAEHAAVFDAMLCDTPAELLRWAIPQIVRWQGCPDVSTPVLQIHGKHDRIIPNRRIHADVVVSGAGHLLNITHAEQVNFAIVQWARKTCPQSSKKWLI
jgi:pimeloyl-ACP methyl ester carboxylesterase